MSKTTSIHDVAKMAGVSIATVSRVVNRRGRVAEKTIQAVEQAVKRLHYSPDIRGRALSMKKTDTVGLVLPDFMGDYYGRLMEGVDDAARRAGLHLMVSRAKGRDEKLEAIHRLLQGGRVDGLLLMLDQQSGDVLLEELTSVTAPLVVLDHDVGHRHLNNVLIDNRTGARDATEHLITAHGIRELIFIGGPRDNVDSMERAGGFGDALDAHDIPRDEKHFITTNYDYDSGFQAARQIVKLLHTRARWGIVAANDDLARGVIESLLREGFKVPQNVAVMGYDDSRLADLNQPRLSTVRVPLDEVAVRAIKIIQECLSDPDSRSSKIILRGHLVLRESCGCGMDSK